MDPQQRLLLERTADAVSCNGVSPQSVATWQSHVGVFVGLSSTDYSGLAMALAPEVTAFTATGKGREHAESSPGSICGPTGRVWSMTGSAADQYTDIDDP